MTINAVQQQDAIDVYESQAGYIVISQQSEMDSDPSLILIAPENVEKVIRALRTAKRMAMVGTEASI